ncbi:hypothetical protein HYPSUDRAFT_1013242 [Hypholoma sublateritium FD-334 SS-4]|uniref:Uncharacterized protein n=1 Tax=Hypholoma sublateritium (strain FD-334 SS-4) TaxID=945553 RepID=A0A0D2NLG6_HYPSF|nr:hypothetical protein HYPSUDRAFT_1013242 [Hypholoma sublateritium FD-334 SS-4]
MYTRLPPHVPPLSLHTPPACVSLPRPRSHAPHVSDLNTRCVPTSLSILLAPAPLPHAYAAPRISIRASISASLALMNAFPDPSNAGSTRTSTITTTFTLQRLPPRALFLKYPAAQLPRAHPLAAPICLDIPRTARAPCARPASPSRPLPPPRTARARFRAPHRAAGASLHLSGSDVGYARASPCFCDRSGVHLLERMLQHCGRCKLCNFRHALFRYGEDVVSLVIQ